MLKDKSGTEWKVVRHFGYTASSWTELYVGTDAAKASEVYESNVRVMRRGEIRLLCDDTRAAEYIALGPTF